MDLKNSIPKTRSAKYSTMGYNDFYRTATKRVNEYFRQKKLSKKANLRMTLKVMFCLFLFFGLYFTIILQAASPLALQCLAIVFGIASTLVGFNIGHDAVHGTLFKSPKLNRFFGYTFELIGMSSYAWYLKHNVVHHTYPNTRKVDFDIEAGPIMRLSPDDKLLPHHRFQHLYAPFTYMLFSLSLVFFGDFKVIFLTKRESIDGKPHPLREKIITVIAKALYIFFMLILPIMLLDIAWWQVLMGFLIMHFVLSIVLAFVLIPAHLFEQTVYPEKDMEGKISTHWAIHQIQTTIDYSRESRLCNFLFGGFNINVVHHLFPTICHIHLIPVSRIVKQTTEEFGITYHETTLWGAIVSHFKTLRMLGRSENFPANKKRADV